MKIRVLPGTLALSLAVAALLPSAAEAAHRHSRYCGHRTVRVYDTYRSPYGYDDRYNRYDYRYDGYARHDRYDPYYDDHYYRSYSPRRVYVPVPVYRPYRSYRYYRSYRPLVGVRVGGPHFGVWVGW